MSAEHMNAVIGDYLGWEEDGRFDLNMPRDVRSSFDKGGKSKRRHKCAEAIVKLLELRKSTANTYTQAQLVCVDSETTPDDRAGVGSVFRSGVYLPYN